MKQFLIFMALLGTAIFLQSRVHSHHAFSSEFDIDKPIRLQGVITRMEWVNPHSWLHMTATLEDGTEEEWMLEGGTPNTLLRQGLTHQILLPGTEIRVRGYQSKDPDCIPKCRGSGRDITFPDGRNIFMGSSGVGAPPGGFPEDDEDQ
ncbi:MAG: hypothetical protein CMQ41_04390 [Gammaproteobacteria bacterium]|nr:hypothetical protein [Gammaproteobacteria bacterium]|tara:strand:+ start:343 stop:786 length:444 start_codon:yes stop_codon:yes gene_type:complete